MYTLWPYQIWVDGASPASAKEQLWRRFRETMGAEREARAARAREDADRVMAEMQAEGFDVTPPHLPHESDEQEERERREAVSAVDAHIAGELQEALDTVEALIASEQPGTERPPPSMAQAVAAASRVLALRTPGALLKIAQALGRIPTASARFMAYMRPWWGTATMLAVWVAALYLRNYNTLDREVESAPDPDIQAGREAARMFMEEGEARVRSLLRPQNFGACPDSDLSLPPSTAAGDKQQVSANGAACPDALRE